MEELYAMDLPPGSTLREKRKRTCILPGGNIRDISVPAAYIMSTHKKKIVPYRTYVGSFVVLQAEPRQVPYRT
jgi:hypothetical protein